MEKLPSWKIKQGPNGLYCNTLNLYERCNIDLDYFTYYEDRKYRVVIEDLQGKSIESLDITSCEQLYCEIVDIDGNFFHSIDTSRDVDWSQEIA